MAETPEKKVKRKVAAILQKYGAYYFYPVTGGFGKSGVPDIIACYHGYFIGIECKAGKNGTSALQEINLEQIRKAGGISLLVNEESIENVTDVLRGISPLPEDY